MKNRVITISREFGSGGRTVGKRTAERLGIPCYDQTLIEQISRESGLSPEFVREKGEYTTHGGWLASVFADRGPDGSSTQDFLGMVQRKVILKLAEEGPCVIVGRCGDYILREAADCLKVFIHADMEGRSGLWLSTGSVRKHRWSACGIRTGAGLPTTGFTPALSGETHATIICRWTAVSLELTDVWISLPDCIEIAAWLSL